jgi:hypothetical protein
LREGLRETRDGVEEDVMQQWRRGQTKGKATQNEVLPPPRFAQIFKLEERQG